MEKHIAPGIEPFKHQDTEHLQASCYKATGKLHRSTQHSPPTTNTVSSMQAAECTITVVVPPEAAAMMWASIASSCSSRAAWNGRNAMGAQNGLLHRSATTLKDSHSYRRCARWKFNRFVVVPVHRKMSQRGTRSATHWQCSTLCRQLQQLSLGPQGWARCLWNGPGRGRARRLPRTRAQPCA